MKKLFLVFCLLTLSRLAFAAPMSITNFDIKENPYEQNQVSIVAVDTLHNTLANINGDFVFTVNGFEDTLKKLEFGCSFLRDNDALYDSLSIPGRLVLPNITTLIINSCPPSFNFMTGLVSIQYLRFDGGVIERPTCCGGWTCAIHKYLTREWCIIGTAR